MVFIEERKERRLTNETVCRAAHRTVTVVGRRHTAVFFSVQVVHGSAIYRKNTVRRVIVVDAEHQKKIIKLI